MILTQRLRTPRRDRGGDGSVLLPLRPAALLHFLEGEQRIGVVVADEDLVRVPLPGLLDDRHALPFEEVGTPALRRLDQMAQLQDGYRGLPDLGRRLLA